MKMQDIAKIANVSTSTVSRTINNPESVQKETRDRVLEVIKELNYKPNLVARQFRTREAKVILVIVPDIASMFFSKILRSIEQVASANGYKVLLCDTNNDINKERAYMDLLEQKQADGVILLTAKLKKEEVEEVANEFPVVLACEYMDDLDVPTVYSDSFSSAKEITEHLIHLGHTKIAHITSHMNSVLGTYRLEGFKAALKSHNIAINPDYIQQSDDTNVSGFDQMQALLALETPPTAVFAFNDEMAIAAYRAIKEKGLKIPEDVAVAGFDNLEASTYVTPMLTTVNQSRHEIGEKATQLLLDLIQGKSFKEKKSVVATKLIVRESCGGNR